MRRIIISVISLFAGGLIYLFFRVDIVGFDVLGVHLPIIDDGCKYFLDDAIGCYFIKFCLGDALWYLSLLLLQTEVMNPNMIESRILFYFSIYTPFVWEFFQLLGVLPGTSDLYDVLIYLFVIFVLWKRDEKFRSLLVKV